MKGSCKIGILYKLKLTLWSSLLWILPAAAQQPKVSARLDSSGILIGQQFHLYLEGTNPSSLGMLIWPQVPDSFNHLLVVARGKIDTLPQPALNIYRQTITLTGFDSGRWQVPAFHFGIISKDPSAKTDTLQTDSLQIMVNTVPVDTTKPFKPIKNIRSVPFNIWDYWYILLILLAVIAGIIGVLWYRKHKKQPKAKPAIPLAPPYETAMKELHVLEEEKLWERGEVKQYYTRLTDILRMYIEHQFHIPAMEQTSDELLQNIRPVTRLNQQRESLHMILQTADLAKFAKLQPSPEEHQACLQKAYTVVEWTKPKPETGDEKNEKMKE